MILHNWNQRKLLELIKISKKVLIQLPYIAITIILFYFNVIWHLQYYSAEWKTALVKVMLKPRKNRTNLELHSPISILHTQCLSIPNACKYVSNHQLDLRRKRYTFEQTHWLVQVIGRKVEVAVPSMESWGDTLMPQTGYIVIQKFHIFPYSRKRH